MALVYYNRGAKHFPRAQEFKEGIKKAEKQSVRTGKAIYVYILCNIQRFCGYQKFMKCCDFFSYAKLNLLPLRMYFSFSCINYVFGASKNAIRNMFLFSLILLWLINGHMLNFNYYHVSK